MRYAFSGVIECGECNSNFRRHNYTNGNKIERTWACKEHLKGNKYCTQEILKEELLEELFVNTLNRLLLNRDKVLKKVEASVKEAMLEVGTDNKQQIEKVDLMIEKLQADMLELNKRRGKREIDAEQYNIQSREVMEQLDELFRQRDELIAEQSEGALSKAQYKMLTDFLKNEQKQTAFDKDVFTKLVEKVIVNSREDITFIFKDGREVKSNKIC